MMRTMWTAAAAAALLASPAFADVLVLKDGRIVDGFEMEQKEGYVEVQLKAGAIQVRDAMVDILLEEGKEIAFQPQTDDEREKFEKGYVRFDGRWTKIRTAKRAIEKGIKDQLEQAREDQKHEEWRNAYVTETKNFVWTYTIPEKTASRFIDACDAYFEIFKKDWKVKRDTKKEKLSINFYGDRGDFNQMSGAGGGTLAYFMVLPPYDLCAFYDRLDDQFTEQVLFHELGHYLQKLIDEDFRYPHWPSESLCEYYSGGGWDPVEKKLSVGLVHNGRLATIKREMDDGKKIELRKMITTRGFEDYTWGWSFVHFLMQDKTRAKQFKKFFIGLAKDKSVKRERNSHNQKSVKGSEVLRYFMECMKLEDEGELRELEREWYEYIEEELQFEGQTALIWEAKTAKQLGERKRARELYAKAFEQIPEHMPANAHYDYAKLLGGGKKALAQYGLAVEKAPLTAMYRWTLAEELEDSKKDEEKKEAELQKAIALELDPNVERDYGRFSFTFD